MQPPQHGGVVVAREPRERVVDACAAARCARRGRSHSGPLRSAAGPCAPGRAQPPGAQAPAPPSPPLSAAPTPLAGAGIALTRTIYVTSASPSESAEKIGKAAGEQATEARYGLGRGVVVIDHYIENKGHEQSYVQTID
jgi:hypothetical protein